MSVTYEFCSTEAAVVERLPAQLHIDAVNRGTPVAPSDISVQGAAQGLRIGPRPVDATQPDTADGRFSGAASSKNYRCRDCECEVSEESVISASVSRGMYAQTSRTTQTSPREACIALCHTAGAWVPHRAAAMDLDWAVDRALAALQLSPSDTTSALRDLAAACQSSAEVRPGLGYVLAGLRGGTAHARASVAPTSGSAPSSQLSPQKGFELEFLAYDAQMQGLLMSLGKRAQPPDIGSGSAMLEYVRSLLPPTHPAAAQGGTSVKAAARLQQRLDRLIADGEVFAAVQLQSQLAIWMLFSKGPDHPDVVIAVHTLTQLQQQQDGMDAHTYIWLLPRAAAQWGVGHPDTRQLVQQAACRLCLLPDVRGFPEFAQTVTDIAQQLPGGLGWGSTVVAPVPDEEAFNRHVVMQAKATNSEPRHYKLAKDMYERCVAFYKTLGPHWLASPRRFWCMHMLAGVIRCDADWAAAEEQLLSTKRQAQRELGMNHPVTLDLMAKQADILLQDKRCAQALSVCQKVIRLGQAALGPKHCKVLRVQVSWTCDFKCVCVCMCGPLLGARTCMCTYHVPSICIRPTRMHTPYPQVHAR